MNIQKIALIFLVGSMVFSCGRKENKLEGGIAVQEAVVSETVSTEVFQQKMNETDNAVVLDVRTPEELLDGYIEGATNLDFRASDFQSKVSALDKNATYFVYCARGGRSRDAADMMKAFGFKNVYDLAGGFNGWSQKGLPAITPQ